MITELILSNKEFLKMAYALIISFVCTLIVIKSDRLFKISDYQGIRYFRNAFFFFGLSIVFRFVLGSVNTTNQEIYSIGIKMLYEFFAIVGVFFLLYSLIWKKVETEKKHHSMINLSALTFYLISLGIALFGFVYSTTIIFSIVQPFLFIVILAISFKNYLDSGREYPFLKVYLIAILTGLVSSILSILLFLERSEIMSMSIYGLNTLFFFIFLGGVISLSKNDKKERKI